MSTVMQDLLHLTWRGRLSMAYYAVRRLFVDPTPATERCFMGAPIGRHVQCPRYAADNVGYWCEHHAEQPTGPIPESESA